MDLRQYFLSTQDENIATQPNTDESSSLVEIYPCTAMEHESPKASYNQLMSVPLFQA